GVESNPRWTRRDSAITFVQNGNLFLVPLTGASDNGVPMVQQLTDVGAKKSEPKLSDSQKFIRDEESKLLDSVREQKEKKKKADAEEGKDQVPSFDLQDRQSALDLMLSPDDVHVFILVAERPTGARNVVVPNYVNETGYTEDIQGRTAVGDTQDRRLLAVLNLKTGKTARAAGSFGAPGHEPRPHGGRSRARGGGAARAGCRRAAEWRRFADRRSQRRSGADAASSA